MRLVAIAAIIWSLIMPAYAYAQEDPSKAEANKAEAEKKKRSLESEKAFQDAVKRIREPEPDANKKRDPWGNFR